VDFVSHFAGCSDRVISDPIPVILAIPVSDPSDPVREAARPAPGRAGPGPRRSRPVEPTGRVTSAGGPAGYRDRRGPPSPGPTRTGPPSPGMSPRSAACPAVGVIRECPRPAQAMATSWAPRVRR